MTRFRITLAVVWCCCWSLASRQLGVKCAPEELEDFPLDADADTSGRMHFTISQRNSSRDGEYVEDDNDDVDDLSSVNESESENYGYETNDAAQDRIVSFNKIMTAAMKEPAIRRNFGQVLPIIRAMSPTQRLTLATLVLKQLTTAASSPSTSAFSHSNLQQLSNNKSAELLLPISADIANMLQSLKKNTATDSAVAASHSGRSTAFGAYYYNPLSASPATGYTRVNNVPRAPVLYSVRRRFQTSANERKKTDNGVPPEMMPPPYLPSANVSYSSFENKKPSQLPDKDDDHGHNHVYPQHGENEGENKNEYVDEDYDTDRGSGSSSSSDDGAVKNYKEQCETFDDNICYDETYLTYPSDRIVNSIKNLEHKHVFGALVQDFVQNMTTEQSPEIERRVGSSISSASNREDTLQLCASKIKFARPKKAKSTNGNWKFIVNTDHYTQTVRIETCVNSEKMCSFLNENVKSHCVQIYNYHRLLTWDEKSGLSLDLFKIPTCCSCQLQQTHGNGHATHANSFLSPAVLKNAKQPQSSATDSSELQDNVIVDQSNVVYGPTVMKPKTKNKFNLTPLPLTPYNTLKRDSFNGGGKIKRPPHPAVLPLQHLDNGGGGSSIRRTSSKANILKGVYVPGRGTLTEYMNAAPGGSGGGSGGGANALPQRVNYNYHPIIDFFRSTPVATAAALTTQVVDRVDADADADADANADQDANAAAAATIDDWLPMTEGPRSVRTRRAAPPTRSRQAQAMV